VTEVEDMEWIPAINMLAYHAYKRAGMRASGTLLKVRVRIC
jgi:hypothetical protein